MRVFNDHILLPYRQSKLKERIAPFLHDVGTVLDVGTKDGRLAYELMKITECHMTGLDVYIQPQSYIDVHHYDGGVFPFSDNSFDCVLMIDMLHHTEDMDKMLAEACRVARRFVIIKDHYWETRLDLIALHVGDFLANVPYNVPLTYNYNRLAEWMSLFKRHKLEEIDHVAFKFNPLEPSYHIITKLLLPKATLAYSGSEKEIVYEKTYFK